MRASGESEDAVLADPRLSPAAVALINAIALASGGGRTPWDAYPPVLNTTHVAQILCMKVSAVQEAACNGSIPMRRVLRKYRIDQVAFRDWLADAPLGGAA